MATKKQQHTVQSSYTSNLRTVDNEAISNLAEKHKVKPEYDLNNDINAAARLYEMMSKIKKNVSEISQQKKQTNDVSSSANKLIKAIDIFLESMNRIEQLSINPVKEHMPVLMRTYTDLSQLSNVKHDVSIVAIAAENASNSFGGMKRGQKEDIAINLLVSSLITSYKNATGNKPGIRLAVARGDMIHTYKKEHDI